MSIYSTGKSKTQKNGPSGTPGPASASPWRAKRGILPKLSTFLSQLKGTLWSRNKFSKKVSQCRKTERGALWCFSTSILSQNIKKLKGEIFIFGKKLTVPKKTERGDPLGFSNIHSDAKQQKFEGGNFIFGKKVSQCRKTERGTLWDF